MTSTSEITPENLLELSRRFLNKKASGFSGMVICKEMTYSDLFCLIQDLLQLCTSAGWAAELHPELKINPSQIARVLELILQLLPIEEAELLDTLEKMIEKSL